MSRRFPWLQAGIRGRVKALRNYVASGDVIVALFPSLFEKLRFLPFNRDFGSAGHNGFRQVNDRIRNVTFVPGGHGCAVETANWPALISFLLGDENEVAPQVVQGQSRSAECAYSCCLFIWPAMLVVIGGLFFVCFWLELPFHWIAIFLHALGIVCGLVLLWLFFQF